MMSDSATVSVVDIARLLGQRKRANRSTILFLGARAGGLFRGGTFYSILERSSPRAFHDLSQVEQFAQCYWVLDQENFTRHDLNAIFQEAFHNLSIADADICLADLVKAAFFDIIISTNVDDMLEKAFTHVGMQCPHDFRIFLPQQDFVEDMIRLETGPSCMLIKIYGDFALQNYVATKGDSYLETHAELRNFLISRLRGDVLVLGYDPHWDRAIGSLFPEEGEAFWYVNEKTHEHDPIFQALKKRKGQHIVGGEGSYGRFMRSLHWHIQRSNGYHYDPFEQQLPHQENASLPPDELFTQQISPVSLPIRRQSNGLVFLPSTMKHVQKKVCIFYDERNKRYLKDLMTHFKPYDREGRIDVWNIEVDHRRDEEIQAALNAARVAILLMSASFFIGQDILPPLLHAVEACSTTLIPVIVSACVLPDELAQFKAFNDSGPLDMKKSSERQHIWAKLVRHVLEQLGATP